jgi:hypothetical protein
VPDVIHDPATDWCACEPGGNVVCDYRLLADAVIGKLNPPDGDEAEAGICIQAVEFIAAFVGSLPCTCATVDDSEPCGRCTALGQRSGEPVGR